MKRVKKSKKIKSYAEYKKNVISALLAVAVQIVSMAGISVMGTSAETDPTIPPSIQAEAAVMINLENNDIIFDKNSTKKMFPASTVKIMTGILAIEYFQDYEQQIVVSEDAVKNVWGNNIAAVEGEVFTVEQLLYALLMNGANDAAAILACEIAGSVEEFVIRMNEKAIALNCTSTFYSNPSGIHKDDMITTAEDTAKIAVYAFNMNKFMEIVNTQRYTVPPTNKTATPRSLTNRNHLVSKATRSGYYYEPARGINAGSTSEAGYCLVTMAEQKGMKYLLVILKSTATGTDNPQTETIYSFIDARNIFEWIFSMYAYKTVVSSKQFIQNVSVELSANTDTIGLVPANDLEYMLPVNVDLEKDIEKTCKVFDERIVAPITKGQEMGELTVSYKGKILGTVTLLSNTDVERSNVLYTLDQIKTMVERKWFKAGVITFLIFMSFYISISIVSSSRKTRRRFR